MSEETPFDTISQRAIVLAKALLSKDSREYHDDIKTFPSEGELAQALMVVMPFFASLHIPEVAPGEFGSTMVTAEPTERLAIILRPCGRVGDAHGMTAAVYKPPGMDGEVALKIMATVLKDMLAAEDAVETDPNTKH
jgi:hypothetical protein